MTFDGDIMVRMHRGEITPAAAFRLQVARQTETTELGPGEEMAEALALLPKCVLDEPIGRGLRAACARYGIRLECRECYTGYREQFGRSRNVITWGMRWRQEQYTAEGRNVLFVENGLLSQRSGRYVDHRGYFADSSIAIDREYARPADERSRAAVWEHVRYEFGAAPAGDPDGPVLVALQTPADAPLRYYCDRLPGDARQYVIDAAAEYLPRSVPVLVRPHPRDEAASEAEYRLPDDWEWQRGGDAYDVLRRCRALITANSTLAIEAAALGLPVACLGRHVFSGSGAVLECDGHPERLAEILDWRPDPVAVERLLVAVMRHQVSVHAGAGDWFANASFLSWAEQCLGGPAVPVAIHAGSDLGQHYEAASQRLRAGADRELQDLVDRSDAALGGGCPACSRHIVMERVVRRDAQEHDGRAPVFGPETLERLARAGLEVMRPDLRGYRERWQAAAGSSTAPRPEIGAEVVLGWMYGGHLGDTLCTTVLAPALTAAGHQVRVVRHRNTYAAFEGHGVGFQNAGRMQLNPPAGTGSGQLCQRLLRWFGLPEEPYPRPEIRVSAAERAWAEAVLDGLPRPRILICPEAVTNADSYDRMPWQAWGDALREAGSVVHVRHHGPELPGCRVVSGLTIRQFLALFSAADAYLGTWAAGIHCAAAFGLETIVVCTPAVAPAAITFPVPQRHIVSFLYPQQAYGWYRGDGHRPVPPPTSGQPREAGHP